MPFVIVDANVWIKYARAKDISPLLERLSTYKLISVVNNYLLSEIFDAVLNNKWMTVHTASQLINFIKKISLPVVENAVYRLSPDVKDNYLFDLAIQNSCMFIISDDWKLTSFILKPVPVHSSSWFLKTFPL